MAVRRRRLGVRARVVASFLVLLVAAEVASVVVLREVGERRIAEEADRDLATAAEELRGRLEGVRSTLGRPDGATLAEVFDEHLRARPARGDMLYLTFVDGRPFAGSAGAPVDLERLDLSRRWARSDTTEEGETRTTAGPMRWLAVPVKADGQVLGVFVATQLLTDQQNALGDTLTTVSMVTVLVLVAACLLAWGLAGRALSPLRELAATARSISTGSDLQARIEVSSRDEVGDLASSFNQMLDDLQTAFDGQTRFLDGTAHELRAPLTIVRGHVELLDDDDSVRTEEIALVLDEVDRMDRLVEELRVLARSERRDFLDAERTDTGALVSGIARKAEALAPRSWQVVSGDLPVIHADGQRLTQAMLNLVENAVHVTSEGQEIEIGAAAHDGVVDLWVRDSGPGIAPEHLPTLFEREGRTVRRRPGGTGLGLPIVAAIARAHGGSVAVTSVIGAGTRIVVTVPREAR